MMFYWGETVKPDGFGLVSADCVKYTSNGIGFFSPKSRIRDVSPGKNLVGFIHGEGNASFIRLNPGENVKTGKKKTLSQKSDKIRLICCGEANAVLLAYGGRILSWEKACAGRPIKELCNITVVQVTCGDQHFMALTNDGQMFTWGENSRGQLGLGKDFPSTPSPQHLMTLFGIPLAQISAGGDHSFALSLSGAVFGWGRNSAGQLGLGHREDIYIPTSVNNLNQKKTLSISCGAEHTVTLSKGGTVFAFGSGQHGQLGHNSLNDELHPRVVNGLWGLNVSQITCGRNHTLALVKSSNTIFSFGCGEQGQLGNGRKANQCVPLPVELPAVANNIHTIERIVAGGNLSFVFCSKKTSDSNLDPNQRKGIVTIGAKMIDSWVSNCESKQWKTIQKEIKGAFSSAACINGSFLEKSCDQHYRSSTHVSGVDMESVRTAFKRLAEKDKVLLEVRKVVEKDLLSSLGRSISELEALRVFLILPELLRVLNIQGHETKLEESYTSAVSDLKPWMCTALENFWSELPETFLRTAVEHFHTKVAKMITMVTFDYKQKQATVVELHNSVQFLQLLHKAFCRNPRELKAGDFIIYEINDLCDMLNDIRRKINNFYGGFEWNFDINAALAEELQHIDTLRLLRSSPCIFTLEAKYSLLKSRDMNGIFTMALRRTALLEDCFKHLRVENHHMLRGNLQVVYCENYERSNVNRGDFFHEVFKILKNELKKLDTETRKWFTVPELHFPEDDPYFLFGLLCGLAFYNSCVVNMVFPLALFKKLLDITPSLDDFIELSPDIGRSLQYLRNYSDDDAENMYMTYTIVWNNEEVELDPDEPGKAVTSSNKNAFVDAYVDYVMNKSVEKEFNEFKRGFYKVCDRDLVSLFQPEELRGVMLGSDEYDWDVFKANATYEDGFMEDHQTIVWFWEVFEELSSEDKKGFLMFMTNSDRVPILGMEQVKMRVRPLLNSTQDHMPYAYTCHTLLDLPVYQTKEILRTKLIRAIHHKRGFWED